ncbi:MAG: dienelactone hydrolase family protein [Bacteroidetes bacterium]|nr:dienelactone hydrolase family protein [Bacteroidota bacterium]
MKTSFYLLAAAMIVACGNPDSKEEEKNQTQEQMDTVPKLVSEEITYQADSVTMKGYLVYDANIKGKRPGVIVVHEWWGHNEHSRNSANKLAEAGYVAFALDMYGDGKTADHPQDAGAFAGAVMKNFDGAKKRFNAAESILKADPHTDSSEIGAIGYCFGGGVVLNMARQGADLDAVATFHGSLGPIQKAKPGSIQGKVLIMNGESDPFTSQETITAFKDEMDSAKVDYTFINYPGAKHSFTNPEATALGEKFGIPLAYNQEASEASWNELLSFLHKVWPDKR